MKKPTTAETVKLCWAVKREQCQINPCVRTVILLYTVYGTVYRIIHALKQYIYLYFYSSAVRVGVVSSALELAAI